MGIGLAPIFLANDIGSMEKYIRNVKPFPKQCSKYSDKDFYTVLWDMHQDV